MKDCCWSLFNIASTFQKNPCCKNMVKNWFHASNEQLVDIFANMIRWYTYSHKSEQLKLCIGNEFCFLFEMLLISLMFLLWLSTLNKVTNLIFVMGRFLILILLIFVRYQFLFCFFISLSKEKILQKTWKALGLMLETSDLQTLHTFANMISRLP